MRGGQVHVHALLGQNEYFVTTGCIRAREGIEIKTLLMKVGFFNTPLILY